MLENIFLVLFLVILLLSGCTNGTMVTIEETSSPDFALSPTSDLDEPFYNNKIDLITNLPSGYIYSLDWSKDSENLFFLINENRFKYEVSSKNISAIKSDETGNSTDTSQPKPIMLNIDEEFQVASLSPSGQKAILIKSNEDSLSSSQSTLSPSNGENTQEPYEVQLFKWEQDNEIEPIAKIRSCAQDTFMWTTNERFVTAQSSCIFPEAWAIDLENEDVFQILPLDEYGGFVYLHGFSPDQKNLLIEYQGDDGSGRENSLFLLELEGLLLTKLDTPRFAYANTWIDDDELLILYAHEFGIKGSNQPAILNIESGELTELLDSEHKGLLNGADVQWMALAPNKKMVAATIEREPFQSSELWLIRLE